MLILALDTTGRVASAALCRDGRLTARCDRDSMMDHSRTILPVCEQMLREQGLLQSVVLWNVTSLIKKLNQDTFTFTLHLWLQLIFTKLQVTGITTVKTCSQQWTWVMANYLNCVR